MNTVLRFLCAILLIEAILILAGVIIAMIGAFIDEILYLPRPFSKK